MQSNESSDQPWYQIKNVDQIASPTVLVYPDRIQANLDRMIAAVSDPSKLRPHVKTHKMPQIIAMKLKAGIKKFKASTIAEVEMVLDAGGRDVLLAYQPVGPNIDRLVTLIKKFPGARLSTLVDNLQTLRSIGDAAKEANVDVPVYVDLNVGMDRTGIVPGPDAEALYAELSRTSNVMASGLHAYDGHLHDGDQSKLRSEAHTTFGSVWKLKADLEAAGFTVPSLVASGTPTSAIMARHDGVEVSAGTTVFWDAGQMKSTPDLPYEPAAVVLARVISHPSPGRICIDLGHKAVASEFPLPRVQFFGLEDAVAVSHSEEHLVLQTDRFADFPVATPLYGLPFHICPTIALHQAVWCVRDHVAVETWNVIARNRCVTA